MEATAYGHSKPVPGIAAPIPLRPMLPGRAERIGRYKTRVYHFLVVDRLPQGCEDWKVADDRALNRLKPGKADRCPPYFTVSIRAYKHIR